MNEGTLNPVEHVARQVAAFDRIRPVYEVYTKVLDALLSQVTRDLRLQAIVQTRAKDKTSFAEKSIRKRHIYPDAVNQLTDLCGGRIICECKDDIEPVCERIRSQFEICEEEDVLDRLGAAQFGYRSVHFIVALRRGEFGEVLARLAETQSTPEARVHFLACLERLYERHGPSGRDDLTPMRGPVFRAEIQVRTLLQHAWSMIGHDRIYKSAFAVPERWQRDANRIAASLEEADEAFSRAVKGVENYRSYFGAYMSPGQLDEEIEILEAVFGHDRHNAALAGRIARLALARQDCHLAEERLRPFVRQWADRLADLPAGGNGAGGMDREQDRGMAALLLEYGRSLCAAGAVEGRKYLAYAAELDQNSPDACIVLAEDCLVRGDRNEALRWFEKAFRIAPSEPHALAGFLYSKLASSGGMDFIPLARPSIEAAIGRCRERASVMVYLPWACFDAGLFHLALGRPYESIAEFALAIRLSRTEEEIGRRRTWIEDLHARYGDGMAGVGWARRLLIAGSLARLVRNAHSPNPESEQAKLDVRRKVDHFREQHLLPLKSGDMPQFATPIIVVAGGAHRDVEEQMQEYRPLLERAFGGFRGTVVSGGTRAGISGIIGDLADDSRGALHKVAYIPTALLPGIDVHSAYQACESGGAGFSPLEPLQMWIDLMASGIDPAEVRVLGIGGGPIAAAEFRIALALGAEVGIVRDSGRAATELLGDEEWNASTNLVSLPADGETLRIFVQGIPPAQILQQSDREVLAMSAHDEYRANQHARHVRMDPVMADWGMLPDTTRDSNLSQIDHIEEKLRMVGKKLCKRDHTDQVREIVFTRDEIEKMAEAEHARWNLERLRSGWKIGARNIEAKQSPYLVSWDRLPEEVKEWDRHAVMALPGMLQKLGYEIVESQG